MSDEKDPDELLSTTQAAMELGLSRMRVQQLIRDGTLPATRVGRYFTVRRRDLDLARARNTRMGRVPGTVGQPHPSKGKKLGPRKKKDQSGDQGMAP